MLTFQCTRTAIHRKTTMSPTEIVIRTCSARASLWLLAVAAGLFLSAVTPGSTCDDVREHAGDATVVLRALPEGGERAYGCCKNPRFGGIDLEIWESGLRGKLRLMVQCRSVACTA